MNLTERTIRSAWWQLITTVLLAVIQVMTTAIMARYLTPSEFGLMSIAMIVFGFVTIFSEVGIGSCIIRADRIDKITVQTGFLVSTLTSSVVFIVVWLWAPGISHFFRNEDAGNIIRLVSCTFLITGLGVVAQSLMERKMKFRQLMVIKTVALAISSIAGIWAAVMGYGVWALVISILTNAAIKTILLFVFHPHPVGLKFDKRIFWNFFNYSIGLTISRTFNYGAQQADNIIVGRWMGTEMLGLYGKAFQLMILPVTYLGQTIDKVTYPGLSMIKENKRKLNEVHLNAITLVNLIMIPFAVAAILTAKEIVVLLLGPDWIDITLSLQILLLTVSFRTSVRMVDSLIRAIGVVYKGALRNLIMFIMIVITCWYAKRWGISGIASAVSISYLMNYLFMTQLALKLIEGSWKQVFKALLPGVYLAGAIMLFTYPLIEVSRYYHMPAAITLVMTSIISCLVFMACYLKFPAVLGVAGVWIRGHVAPLVKRVHG